MKALFTIDQGNSNPHVGIFQDNILKKVLPLEELKTESPSEYNFDSIFSNVGKPISHLKETFPNGIDLSNYRNEEGFLEMPIHYSETLGMDRIVQAYGIYSKLKKDETTLLIDSGTFTTIDVISKNGFMGGYIFPGLKLLLSSFNNGHLLPKISNAELKRELSKKSLPKNTKEAMIMAVNLLIWSPLEAILQKAKINNILITGGNADLYSDIFNEIVEGEYKVTCEPHFIHYSLKLIFNQLKDFRE